MADSIQFKVFAAAWDEEKDEFFSRSTVRISSLDSTDWEALKKLTAGKWIALLKNPLYDWGANLALYALYQKEAYALKSVNTRAKWVKSFKAKDIESWRAEFSQPVGTEH